ncbi:uncharacterized protein PRCAT00001850001 [Priceomyces carsonii]|uniref:uncharacterized protein n=1 Tax=Priceomyces carsonii TaxID=28549 RepID=UPI002ED95F6E|nr:unnamed protein product [Priceomyces carsonii]
MNRATSLRKFLKPAWRLNSGPILSGTVVVLLLFVFIMLQSSKVSFSATPASSTMDSAVADPEESGALSKWAVHNLPGFDFQRSDKTLAFADTNGYVAEDLSLLKDLKEKEGDMKSKFIYEMDGNDDYEKKHRNLAYEYYERIFEVLYQGRPNVSSLDSYQSDERIYHARYDSLDKDEQIFDEEYLSKFLQLTDEELNTMTRAHRFVVENLPESSPKDLYSGNGIVYVGGGEYNWLTLLSVKSIRALGCTLPIEILIPTIDEYEPDLCARVFPALNAKCIYLPTALYDPKKNSAIPNFEFKGYQYKALAILVLSFENVLFLDSDNIPVSRPDDLFTQEPFTSRGLIVWPDFWKRATSPYYYQIAGMKLGKNLLPRYNEVSGDYEEVSSPYSTNNWKKFPLHQREGSIPDPTSESGQLMINKATHIKALLLALYYNLYGPTHFYPLFSQGSDGEGDKETFLAATCALKKPYYQVSKFLNAFGYFKNSNDFEGTAMGQYNPIDDFHMNMLRKELATMSSEERSQLIRTEETLEKGPRILFVHSNFPKLNPWSLKTKGTIFNDESKRIRIYGLGMRQRMGYDFETVQWTNMKFLLCDLKIQLKAFDLIDLTDLCKEVSDHLDFLKSTSDTLE